LEEDLVHAGNLIAQEIIDGQINRYQYLALTDVAVQEVEAVLDSEETNDVAEEAVEDVVDTASDSADDSDSDDGEPESDPKDSADTDSTDNDSSYDTNTQVKLIDEADIIKSDGEFMYISYGKELAIYNLSGNSTYRVMFNQTLFSDLAENESESIQEIILSENELYAISTRYQSSDESLVTALTRLSRFAITEEGELNYIESKQFSGTYQTLRKNSSHLFLIVNNYLDHYNHFRSLYRSQFSGVSDDEYIALASAKIQDLAVSWKNKIMNEIFQAHGRSLDAEGLERIVAIHQVLSGDESEEDYELNASKGQGSILSYAQLVSIDLSAGLNSEELSGKFNSNHSNSVIYIDNNNIAIGGYGLSKNSEGNYVDATLLTTFSLESGAINPQSIATVKGFIPASFGIRAVDDVYQCISTLRSQFDYVDGSWQQTQTSESMVSCLQRNGDEFKETGKVTGLGENETLRSSRFIDDKAYVVTFRQIDPFYVVDLSTPTTPVLLGELKIPGYSSYLHPLDDDHILGVGRDGSQLLMNLFNVSDATDPQLLHSSTVAGYSSSALEYDYKALRYIASSKTLVIPVSSYSYNSVTRTYDAEDGFRLYTIDYTTGFEHQGNASHYEDVGVAADDFYRFSPYYLKPRSFFFSPNQLITAKGHTLKSWQMDDLSQEWVSNLDDDMIEEIDFDDYWYGCGDCEAID
ncbi:MAG: beta-propeller domain-containing protein, partial [Planctomycetes bacterium]|nr:beta-propeller domain-containing protein [Planctomycetota bacterium]